MNPLPLLRHWLRGIGKLRGFGIQSPWAYDFVRNVVAERNPYYKYTETDPLSVNRHERRLCRLLLRIANFCQPATAFIDDSLPAAYADSLKAGCTHMQLVGNPREARLLLLPVMSPHVKTVLSHLPHGTTIMIFGINQTAATRQRWAEVCADTNSTTTFNLWKTGIIFVQDRYQQQHYTLNF